MRRDLIVGLATLVLLLGGVPALAQPPAPTPVEPKAKTVKPLGFDDALVAMKDLKPGKYQIVVIHPYTCCPVTVCFCLPCGCYCLRCETGLCAKKMRFVYKGLCNDVVLKFHKDGSVSVKD